MTKAARKKQIALGDRLGKEGKWQEAREVWAKFLKSEPENPAAMFNLGYCTQMVADGPADRVAAIELYERVINSPHPISDAKMKANCMNQIALMMRTIGHEGHAFKSLEFALSISPEHSAAKVNHADSLRALGLYDAADKEYQAILANAPDNAEARMCSGMLALTLGDYKRGWQEYRWRWKVPTFTTKPFKTEAPMWDGENLDGRTLLIYAEQGWGDQIMFARYITFLSGNFAALTTRYLCDPLMHRLMGGLFGLDVATASALDSDEFDYWIPLMDIPAVVGTTLDTIPEAHCIRPMPDWPVWKMQGNLLRRRIALVWAGSVKHGKDSERSIQPEALQPIIDAHPGCDFYSLQAGPKSYEVARLNRITDLVPEIENWTTTAQMLMCMDLLISVDTAVAHLCGAVGIPAWILLPYSPDFRWGLSAKTTGWYPRARLFRQPEPGDWASPIQDIIQALK